MSNKRNEDKKQSRRFIYGLKKLTAGAIKGMASEEYYSSAKSLRELFDSFAIIEEFYDPLDCYWETKIALQKYARFVDKSLPYARDFKNLLIHFFVVIEDIYFYETYGFFSTRMHPKEIPGLPVICQCGCLPFWPLEPVVDSFGHVIFKRVIRFYNKDRIRPLCMTISKNPEILEGREKCRLTDEEIEGLKAFVRKNRDLIRRHYKEELDSIDFIMAVQKRSSKNNNVSN